MVRIIKERPEEGRKGEAGDRKEIIMGLKKENKNLK